LELSLFVTSKVFSSYNEGGENHDREAVYRV
jgi:hypothetical protein